MRNSNEDLSQSVHQLRMLLVEKEEEIEALKQKAESKGGAESAAGEGTPPGELTGKLEEALGEIGRLEKELSKTRDEAARKIDELREEMADSAETDGGERLDEAMKKIAGLEEELNMARAGAGDDRGESGDDDELQARLSSAQKELERAERTFRRAKEKYSRLGTMNMWMTSVSAILAIWLCISLVVIFKQKRTLSRLEGGIDFITAAEEPVMDMEERLPPADGEETRQAAVAEPAAPDLSQETHFEYTVKKGDNLWKICKRQLGNANLADRVARENNLSNPGALKVGTTLYLPKLRDE